MKRNMLENHPQIEKQKTTALFHPKWNYHFQKPNYHNQRTEVNCRIVLAMQMALQVVLVDELPMEFPLCFATVGSFPHCKWDASGAGGWVADGIPLWFATLGSFPHCKWDCKWCWWRSCRWNSIVICNCRIVLAMQMALQVALVEELPMELHCALQL